MCGIVGYSSKDNFNLDKIKLLLTYNSLKRGEDALGIFSPINGLKKEAGLPVELIPKFNLQEDDYLIAHVRAHSSGGKLDQHAHPFQHKIDIEKYEGTITGVMNGTIENIWSLVRKHGLKSTDYSVDSDGLFAILAKNNSFSSLSEIKGGCAILINDSRFPNTLYVYRNADRPLFRGNIENSMYI